MWVLNDVWDEWVAKWLGVSSNGAVDLIPVAHRREFHVLYVVSVRFEAFCWDAS